MKHINDTDLGSLVSSVLSLVFMEFSKWCEADSFFSCIITLAIQGQAPTARDLIIWLAASPGLGFSISGT